MGKTGHVDLKEEGHLNILKFISFSVIALQSWMFIIVMHDCWWCGGSSDWWGQQQQQQAAMWIPLLCPRQPSCHNTSSSHRSSLTAAAFRQCVGVQTSAFYCWQRQQQQQQQQQCEQLTSLPAAVTTARVVALPFIRNVYKHLTGARPRTN